MSFNRDLTPRQSATGCASVIVFLLALGLVTFFAFPPVIHGLFVSLWSHFIGWILVVLVCFGVTLYLSGRQRIGVPLAAVALFLWIVTGLFGTAFKHEAFLDHAGRQAIEDEPDTTGFRFLPLEVAQTTATNKTSDPTVTPGSPEPLIDGSEAKWIVPMEPNNTSTHYFGSQPGSLTINTTADTTRDTTEYDPGFGLCCFGKTIGWESVNEHFWADYSPEKYMTVLNGETVIVQPYLTYRFDWSNPLPVMVQDWGGDLIFRSDGSVEDVSADEAATEYPGGRLYPEELASYFATSMQYKDGIWNYLFTHKDLPDVPHLDGQENQFPFLIPTDQGAEWYTAVEPYGSSKSAYMSYYINATTGAARVYKFTEPLVGPERAETFVNNAFNQLKGTYFYEPRPLINGDHTYWMLSASASGTPDVQFTALVDTYSEDVIKLARQSDVERVVSGEDPHRVGEVVSASGTTSTSEDTSTPSATGEGTMSNEELVKALREAADRLEQSK